MGSTGSLRSEDKSIYGEFSNNGLCRSWRIFGEVLKKYYPAAYIFYNKLTIEQNDGNYLGELSPQESEQFMNELDRIDKAEFLEKTKKLINSFSDYTEEDRKDIIYQIDKYGGMNTDYGDTQWDSHSAYIFDKLKYILKRSVDEKKSLHLDLDITWIPKKKKLFSFLFR